MHNQSPSELGYWLPAEWERHEGTWLQWPHDHIHDDYQLKLERIWLAMTEVLRRYETVHIVATNEQHRDHIAHQLSYFDVGLSNIDLLTIPTDDVWVRDNGPIFLVNDQGDLVLTDWNFNGWGGRFDHPRDAKVAATLGASLSLSIFASPMVMEGGSVSVNGAGAFMATDSSIINDNRNPGLAQEEIEGILKQYLGVNHFIWLSGAGQGECEQWGDTTDSHIDVVSLIEHGGAIGCVTQPQPALRLPAGTWSE